MTIQNNTARRIMYEWHDGQTSAFYAAASSGLCASFDALEYECRGITDPDKEKLLRWIVKQKTRKQNVIIIRGQSYSVLPWVSRSYYAKG